MKGTSKFAARKRVGLKPPAAHDAPHIKTATINVTSRVVEVPRELVEQVVVAYLMQNNYALPNKPELVDQRPTLEWRVEGEDFDPTDPVAIASCRVTFAQLCKKEE